MPHQCTDCSHVFPDGSKAMLSGCPDCGGNTFQFLPEKAIPDGEVDDAGSASATDTDTDPTATAGDTSEAPSASGRVPVESAESTESTSIPNADDSVAPPEPSRKSPPPDAPRGRLERATEALRSFVFDPPASTPRSVESERAGDSGDSGTDAARESDPDDTTEHTSSSIRNGGDEPVEDEAVPDSGTRNSASVADAAVGDIATGPSPDTGPEDRTDPSTSVGSGNSSSAPSDVTDARTPPIGAEDGRIAAEPSEDRPDLEELRRELNDQFESIKIVEPGQYELNLMELYNREEYIIALREDGRYAIEAPETWLGRRADRE